MLDSRRSRAFLVSIVVLVASLVIPGMRASSDSAAAAITSETMFGSVVPAHQSDPDSAKVELGAQFKATVNGTVAAIRFYKGTGNTGTHTGRLYGPTGTLLKSVTFTAESATGWQQAMLSAPVAVTAGVMYTVSYVAPNGHYADDTGYPWPKVSGDLTALSGVYKYGEGFPTSVWQSSNYYVDVVFAPEVTPTSGSTTASSTLSDPPTSASTTSPTTTTAGGTATTTSPSPSGWFTSDPTGQIIDPDGKVFIPVGVNANGPDWVWIDATIGQSANMDKWRFNTLRVNTCYVGGCPSPDGTVSFDWHTNDDLDGIVSEYTAKKYVIMIDSHMWSGDTYVGHEQTIVDWWKATATRYKDNPYVWFNLINEPTTDPNGLAEWARLSTLIANAIRSEAPQNMLVIDGNTWGQDKGTWTCDPLAPAGPDQAHPWQYSAIVNKGPAMQAAFGPVTFSVHTYGMWGGNETQGCTPVLWDATFKAYVDKVHSLHLPLLIGETGAHVTKAEEQPFEAGVWNAMQMVTRVLPTLPVKIGIEYWAGSSGSPYNLYSPFHSWTEYDKFRESLDWMGQFVSAYAHQVNPVVAPPTTTPVTTPPATPTATTTGTPILNLPRIPWEGGPDYYRQFPNSAKWTDPNVFPIGIWWDDFDTASNVAFDKDKAINFFVELNGTESMRLIQDAGMYWVGDPLPGATSSDPNRPGVFLGDEVDGRFDPPSTGIDYLQNLINSYAGEGRFGYSSFSAIIASYYNDAQIAADNTYVNMTPGPVSATGYWYTDTHCFATPYVDYSFYPIDQAHCATASSYGKMTKSVRARDASDGRLQPIWNFVETQGGGTESAASGKFISPGQIQGAVMDSIINEARGIVYFNQAFFGPCTGGNLIRLAEVSGTASCMWANIQGMKKVNLQIQALAPVINTQSYVWEFGPNLDTMLKVKDGSAYIFSMINGSPTSFAGARTFTLPPGVTGTSVEVLNEARTIPIINGQFSDTFPQEYSYHVYRVTL